MRFVSLLPLVLFACATTPSAPSQPEPPLPRTSIAAVLEHRDELHFTGEQLSRLEDIERVQLAKLDDLRATMARRADESQPSAAPQMRGGGRGMGRGGRGGGGHPHPRPPPEVLDKIDDLDTTAFMEAIAVFTEEQKQPAIQIASDYRSRIYERRKRRHDGR